MILGCRYRTTPGSTNHNPRISMTYVFSDVCKTSGVTARLDIREPHIIISNITSRCHIIQRSVRITDYSRKLPTKIFSIIYVYHHHPLSTSRGAAFVRGGLIYVTALIIVLNRGKFCLCQTEYFYSSNKKSNFLTIRGNFA